MQQRRNESQNTCGLLTVSSANNITFNSTTEIDNATFRLELDTPFGTTCQNNPGKSVSVQAYLAANPTIKVGPAYGFSLSTGKTGEVKTGKLRDISSSAFQVNTAYIFKLTTNDSWGKFSLYYPEITGSFTNITVGGLRVKSIRSSDGISSSTGDIVKTYEYTFDAAGSPSSGRLLFMPSYGFNAVAGVADPRYNDPGAVGVIEAEVFDERSIVPMSSFEGYHIGYTRVTEVQAGNGYTVYTYIPVRKWFGISAQKSCLLS